MNYSLRATLLLAMLSCVWSNGSLAQIKTDSSFNLRGNKLVIDPISGCTGLKMVTSADGNLFVAGMHGSDSLSIWKLLPNGSVDANFGKGGAYSVYTGWLAPSIQNISILLQRDKKIVVMAAGQHVTVPINNSESSIILLRINANGTPDLSFNGTGLLIHHPSADYQFTPLSLTIDSSGSTDKFYVSSLAVETGSANCPSAAGKWCISKYNSNGTADLGFNGNGFIIESSEYIRNGSTRMPMALILSMKVTASGCLLAAGAFHAEDSAFFMFRLNADGTIDNSFGTSGRVLRPFSACTIASNQWTSARILKDESVLFATNSDVYTNSQYDSSLLYMIKCNSNGTQATGFGNSGVLATQYVSEGHHQYTIDSNNKILVYWNAAKSSSQFMHFRSFTANGKPDYAYSTNGYEVVEPISQDAVMYATLYDALWTKDNKNLFVLERRFDVSNHAHIGVFKYKIQPNLSTTAVREIAQIDFTVKPQPATGYIDLSITGINKAVLTLINAEGRVVYQTQNLANGASRIDLSHLARGLYFLNITDIQGAKATKPVILD
jgi:uncharacterized delta-60 repeat protein